MKNLASVCLLLSAGLGSAWSQQRAEALIESRQAEVARLAPVYFIDLSRGVWKHEKIDPCPAFTQHVFAKYERTSAPGVISSFIAVYPLNHSPGSVKKPWTGGILLIPFESFAPGLKSVAERPSTWLVFNRVWSDELEASGHPNQFPSLDWGAIADCYAMISGEQPAPLQVSASDNSAPFIDFKDNPVSSIMIPVVGNSGSRTLHLALDSHGMITEATLR